MTLEIITIDSIAGLLLLTVIIQVAVWISEIREKKQKYKEACQQTVSSGKPMLVIGGPYGGKKFRHWFHKPAHGSGDVCMDIDPSAIKGYSGGVLASITDIPVKNKVFGAAFASHVLEHLPDCDDAMTALNELHRVADEVYIVVPSKKSIGGWLTAGHHLWIKQKGDTTTVQERDGAKRTVTW